LKIAIIGATGNAGSRILEEALQRSHEVTALVREASKLKPRPHLVIKPVDISNLDSLSSALSGQDILISAFLPPRGTPDYAKVSMIAIRSVLQAAEKAGVKRYLIVGGAGSLWVAEGVSLVDTPNFPPEYKVEASAMRDVYMLLQKEAKLDWVFLAPSAFFTPGKRTGKFRIGHNYLISDSQGQSAISMEDYAIALLDEVERPVHHRERFTVGY
jgi:putative NADH-flavin reductase